MTKNLWNKITLLLSLLLLGFLFGVIAFASQFEIRDLDIWFHIGMGRYIIDQLYVPLYDVVSFSFPGKFWVNHEWLFQIFVAHLYDRFDYQGLHNMQLILVVTTFLLLLRMGFNPKKMWLSGVLLLFVFFVFSSRFTYRPDLFSVCLVSLFLLMISSSLSRWSTVFVLCLLQVFWTNIHGYFFLGPYIFLITCMGETLKRFVRLPYQWNHIGRLSNKEFLIAWVTFIVLSLSTIVHPSGLEGALYPFKTALSLYDENRIFFQHIQELRPTLTISMLFDLRVDFAYKVWLMISIVILFLSRRRLDITLLLLWLSALVLSLLMVRNSTYFAILSYALFWGHSQDIRWPKTLSWRANHYAARETFKGIVNLLLILFLFNMSRKMAVETYFDWNHSQWKSAYKGFSVNKYPERAIEFMKSQKLKGNIFNDFNSGAYLIGHLHPDSRVFIDGRTEFYGGSFFKNYYYEIFKNGNKDIFKKINHDFDIDIVFLSLAHAEIPRSFIEMIGRDAQWVPVYFDSDALVFVKNVTKHQAVIDEFRIDFDFWASDEIDHHHLGTRIDLPEPYYHRALVLTYLQAYDAAEREALKALAIRPDYAGPYFILGRKQMHWHNFQKASHYLRIAVMLSPAAWDLRLLYADSLRLSQRFKEADYQYQVLVKLDPDSSTASYGLVANAAAGGNSEKALTLLNKSFERHGAEKRAITEVGEMFYLQRDFETMQEVFQMASLSGLSDNGDIMGWLALSHWLLEDRKAAVSLWQNAIQLNVLDQSLLSKVPEDWLTSMRGMPEVEIDGNPDI